jgi:hypothetical protein
VGRAGDGAKQRRGELGVQHAGLVDDDEVSRERVLRVGREASGGRIELQQPVDGRSLDARGLLHALGGAARRGAQQHPDALGDQDVAQRLQDRRLARTRPAGEHADFAAEGHHDRRGLRFREAEAGAFLGPRHRLLGVDGGQAARRRPQAANGRGDGTLGVLLRTKLQQPNAFGVEHADGVFLHQDLHPILHDGAVDLEQLGRLFEQAFLGVGAMAFALEFLEAVQDAGVDALRTRGGQAEVAGDLVGGLEADAFDLPAHAVRFGGEHLLGVLAVGLHDAEAEGVRDAVGLQEHHDLAEGLLVFPGRLDRFGASRADAVDLAQAGGLIGDDVERPHPELGDDLVGVGLADAFDQAAAEVFADPMDRGGQP